MVEYRKIKIVFLFIGLPLYSFCQNSIGIKKQSEIIPMLCHKWNIDSKIASFVKQYPPAETFSTIRFITNGSVIIQTDTVIKGIWNYDVKTSNLSLKVENKVFKLKIVKLTNKELVFEKHDDYGGESQKGSFWRAD